MKRCVEVVVVLGRGDREAQRGLSDAYAQWLGRTGDADTALPDGIADDRLDGTGCVDNQAEVRRGIEDVGVQRGIAPGRDGDVGALDCLFDVFIARGTGIADNFSDFLKSLKCLLRENGRDTVVRLFS
jgi:hypothetical protein